MSACLDLGVLPPCEVLKVSPLGDAVGGDCGTVKAHYQGHRAFLGPPP